MSGLHILGVSRVGTTQDIIDNPIQVIVNPHAAPSTRFEAGSSAGTPRRVIVVKGKKRYSPLHGDPALCGWDFPVSVVVELVGGGKRQFKGLDFATARGGKQQFDTFVASRFPLMKILGATWSKAASIDDVLASRDSLRKGDQGDAVKYVQRFLGLPEDGKYGADTEKAVTAFQDAHVTDPHQRGVVNAATFRALVVQGTGVGSPQVPGVPQSAAPPLISSPVTPSEAEASPATAPIWKKVLFAGLAAGAVGGGALLLRRKSK